jgi:hypothetical protein
MAIKLSVVIFITALSISTLESNCVNKAITNSNCLNVPGHYNDEIEFRVSNFMLLF